MKKIVMFGTGIEAEKFFCRYSSKYHVEFVIDNYRGGSEFHGLPCYKLNEVSSVLGEKYVVLAVGRDIYREISNILKDMGLVEFSNFIWGAYFEKKIAILYGNCHVGAIADFLKQSYEFARIYSIQYFFVNELEKGELYPREEEVKNADLLIVQDLREDNKLGIPGAEWIKAHAGKKTKVVVIPNLWGINFVWPQIRINRLEFENLLIRKHINNNAVLDKDSEIVKKLARGIIGHHDAFLDANMNTDTVLLGERIRNEEIFSNEEIVRLFSSAIEKLKGREDKCDIKISDFILENISKMQLFYDIGHPHENILLEKTNRILDFLGISRLSKALVHVNAYDQGEIFVYGCVRKVHEMKWEKEVIRSHNTIFTLDGHGITLEEYIDAYKAWR